MRERDARGNGGGFAPLEASCRRVVALLLQFPRLLAVRSRFEVAWRPKRRPPRRKTPTMGCRGRGGLRSGHNGARPRVELARKPLNMRVNPLDTHVNLSTCAWEALPTRISSGPRARCRAHARVSGAQARGEECRQLACLGELHSLTPSAHTWPWPLVRPHIRYVGAFTPHDETIPVNVGFTAPASRKVPTKPARYILKPRHSTRPVARGVTRIQE